MTTGEPGTEAIVTNSGTESAAILDFTIPRGDPGTGGGGGGNTQILKIPKTADFTLRTAGETISLVNSGSPESVSATLIKFFRNVYVVLPKMSGVFRVGIIADVYIKTSNQLNLSTSTMVSLLVGGSELEIHIIPGYYVSSNGNQQFIVTREIIATTADFEIDPPLTLSDGDIVYTV